MHLKFNTPLLLTRLLWLHVALLTATVAFGQTADDIRIGQNAFNEGLALQSKGDNRAAIDRYSDAIAKLPDWHLPYLNRGSANLSIGRLDSAESDADAALRLIRPETPSANQHTATAHQIKGTVRQQKGDLTAALELFQKAVEFDPQNAKLYNSVGTTLRLLNRIDEALVAHNRSIELDPKMAIFFVNRSYIYERKNDRDAAFKDLDEALRLDNKNGSAFYTRGAMRMRASALNESLADLDRAIELESNRSVYFHARGIVHYKLKNFDKALSDQSKAIELDPQNGNAYADRAIIHSALKNLKGAIADLRSALSISGNSAVLKYNLAYFLYQDGQFSESVKSAGELITQHPNWKAPYLLRSNGYIKLGMQEKARADRAKASGIANEVKPNDPRYTVFTVDVALQEG